MKELLHHQEIQLNKYNYYFSFINEYSVFSNNENILKEELAKSNEMNQKNITKIIKNIL